MTIKKTETGWLVDSQPGGRGAKRFRKLLKTLAEAKAYEAWLRTQVTVTPDWQPTKRDTRKLSELIDLWFSHHGTGLRSGDDTHRRLLAIAEALGDPSADRFTVDMFAQYRTKRLAEGVSANNLNREHAYLRAAFNELARLGYWSKDNPLGKLRQFKIQENELSFLSREQIIALLSALRESRNPHVLLITKTCLATGARWSEAEELRVSQVRNGLIQFARTKSGKTRAVPIDDELSLELVRHHRENGQGERVFGYAWSAFREGIERAGITLPDGQMTHSLRHTFASHFMMGGGNILALQRILGHQSLTMTMRYAHLSPDHLIEARRLNPLVAIKEAHAQSA
ncbi:phage integrase [Burkholderia cenocepacia]|uniref:phage integrase n=1 Tax=Burkholderia cenocepacia TaxID=95486 RepID=UPI0024B637ED|nr:tyrosine-type recombinase/integrase [Burkholderia cenocepacia]MDI9676901.1 tyrosine-type recombinase/integrase [Burkholderia cenocepacia]